MNDSKNNLTPPYSWSWIESNEFQSNFHGIFRIFFALSNQSNCKLSNRTNFERRILIRLHPYYISNLFQNLEEVVTNSGRILENLREEEGAKEGNLMEGKKDLWEAKEYDERVVWKNVFPYIHISWIIVLGGIFRKLVQVLLPDW